MAAEIGIVNTQAHTIWLATRQCTARRRRMEPTPTMAPVIGRASGVPRPTRMVPLAPTAQAVLASIAETPYRVLAVPLVCATQETPALVV